MQSMASILPSPLGRHSYPSTIPIFLSFMLIDLLLRVAGYPIVARTVFGNCPIVRCHFREAGIVQYEHTA